MPFAYFPVLIFAQMVGKTWTYLTLKLVFLILTLSKIKAVAPKCTSCHSVLY